MYDSVYEFKILIIYCAIIFQFNCAIETVCVIENVDTRLYYTNWDVSYKEEN